MPRLSAPASSCPVTDRALAIDGQNGSCVTPGLRSRPPGDIELLAQRGDNGESTARFAHEVDRGIRDMLTNCA